jgi:hypothetical protein
MLGRLFFTNEELEMSNEQWKILDERLYEGGEPLVDERRIGESR